jgi:hypothetical protein
MVGLEARQGERERRHTALVQVVDDLVPGPGTEPEARDEDDVGATLGPALLMAPSCRCMQGCSSSRAMATVISLGRSHDGLFGVTVPSSSWGRYDPCTD